MCHCIEVLLYMGHLVRFYRILIIIAMFYCMVVIIVRFYCMVVIIVRFYCILGHYSKVLLYIGSS